MLHFTPQPHVAAPPAPLLDPWQSIWTDPRATIRQLVQTRPEHMVLALAAAGGLAQVLARAMWQSSGDHLPVAGILFLAIVLGPVFGVIGLYITGALLKWTGDWLGGRGTSEHLRTAVAWANVPTVASLVMFVGAFALFKEELFTTATPRVAANLSLALAMVLYGICDTVLGIWSLVILCKGVGEVQGFSAWTGLGNVILAGLVIVVPFLIFFSFLMVMVGLAA